jgi:hypothetical protein
MMKTSTVVLLRSEEDRDQKLGIQHQKKTILSLKLKDLGQGEGAQGQGEGVQGHVEGVLGPEKSS